MGTSLGVAESVNRVTSTSAGLVAVGGGVFWTSVDGEVWSVLPLPGSNRDWLRSLTSGGPGVVAVGHVESGPARAAVWVATMEELTQ